MLNMMVYSMNAKVISNIIVSPSMSKKRRLNTTVAVAIPFGAFKAMYVISPRVYPSECTLKYDAMNLIPR